ncbi:MAG: hypothetical protein IIB38_15660, partial [Candidatus Hydrogenedentes bacterium]|nr:hypothetical protein [Candidatus Hydrogenedentota bacterium]
MGAHRFADVALPLSVDQSFTYRVPEALESRIAVGMRALVPVRNRMETGYVTGLHESTELDTLRDVIDLPDSGPVFSGEMLALCEWVSQYYCCSLGEALQCAVPAGIAIRSEKRYTLNLERLDQGRYTKRQQEVVAELHRNGPQTEKQLAKSVGRAALSNALQSLGTRGTLAVETIATDPNISVRTETWIAVNEDHVLEPKVQAALQRRAPKQ